MLHLDLIISKKILWLSSLLAKAKIAIMTVVTKVSANQYIGDCATTEFDYKFKIFSEQHLVVTMTDSNGDHEQRLTLNRDYTVTGVNSDEGGKIILSSPLIQ
ncbi:MAG: hypothetical protein ACL7BU_05305 [Candidatus Phlomobacter fragariae]